MADSSEKYNRQYSTQASLVGLHTAGQQSNNSIHPTPLPFKKHTVAPQESEFIKQEPIILGHPSFVEGSSIIVKSDGLLNDNLVVYEQDGVTYLEESSHPALAEPARNMMVSELGPNTHSSNANPSHGSFIHQHTTYPPGPIYDTASPQVISNDILINENLMMDHPSTWSIRPNILYSNTYPSSTVPSYTTTTHPLSPYPNTNHTQLAVYVHKSSPSDLPFSEWLIQNNDCEYEKGPNL